MSNKTIAILFICGGIFTFLLGVVLIMWTGQLISVVTIVCGVITLCNGISIWKLYKEFYDEFGDRK